MGIAAVGRRLLLTAMLGSGVASTVYGSMDPVAWRAYETVEESWIRDRHQLIVQLAPAAVNAARLDLELRLADLNKRAIQFRHLLSCDPTLLRGGVWQMTALPVSEAEHSDMLAKLPEYRHETERIRHMTDALHSHPQYDTLRRTLIRLWKTPQYREIHRKYMGRMQELQQLYSGSDISASATSN